MTHPEQPRIISPEIKRRKETLNDAELNGFLSSVGNHEGKAALLASMKFGVTYESTGLDHLIQIGGGKVWSRRVPIGWCAKSFAPIGLVARELIDPKRGTVGYEITEKGINHGIALAGHLLSFSEKHPTIDLYNLLGRTASRGKIRSQEDLPEKNRAPMTRYRIFKELVNSSLPLRAMDLYTSLHSIYPAEYPNKEDIGSLTAIHLRPLTTSGIITYKSINADAPFVSFTKTADPMAESSAAGGFFTNHIRAIVQRSESPLTYQTTYKEVLKHHPFYQKKDKGKVISRIAIAYHELIQEGIVRKEGEFSKESQSTITLTKEQYAALYEFVEIIEKFSQLDPAFLAEGRRKATEVISDPDRFATLMKKAWEASPMTGRKRWTDLAPRIIAFIKNNPNCINEDIQTFLEKQGDSYQRNSVNKLIRNLIDGGEIKVEKKGSKNFFSVPEDENTQNIQEGETVIFQAGME